MSACPTLKRSTVSNAPSPRASLSLSDASSDEITSSNRPCIARIVTYCPPIARKASMSPTAVARCSSPTHSPTSPGELTARNGDLDLTHHDVLLQLSVVDLVTQCGPRRDI